MNNQPIFLPQPVLHGGPPPPIKLAEMIDPCHDLILLERASSYKGVIVIPDSAREQEQTAVVIAIGPGKINEEGVNLPMCCKPGDRVFLHPDPRVGHKIKLGERELVLVGNSQILGVFRDERQPEA